MSASALESGLKFVDTRSVLDVRGFALLTLSFQTLGKLCERYHRAWD